MTGERTAWVRQIMGLPISVHLRGGPAAGAGQAVDEAFAIIEEADELFSTYRPDSEISRLNRGELTVGECSPPVREVLALCERARDRTGGAFDPWRASPAGVDPSGLVKGWAAQRAAERLALLGGDYYLNAGGDIALGRGGPLAPFWRIGVEDPRDHSVLLGVLALGSGAVATSGITRRGAHIADPVTGRPATSLLSATVTGPSLMWADVYATAIIARGGTSLDWLAGLGGYEALLVAADGGVHQTAGMRALLHPAPVRA
jgi:thiamine biosynthesis lipoprotein